MIIKWKIKEEKNNEKFTKIWAYSLKQKIV